MFSGCSKSFCFNRIQTKKTDEPAETSTRSNKIHFKKDRLNSRRRDTTRDATTSTTTTTTSTTSSSLLIVTPSYTTPAPPPTPDPGSGKYLHKMNFYSFYASICTLSDFKCEDEGFFPHPRDCKKYFWCLSSGPSELGIVAHQFTCPSGIPYLTKFVSIFYKNFFT